MRFYESIAKYYDYIFPVGMEEVDFISKIAGPIGKEILDIACGTGGYSIELVKKGYNLTATDLDSKMIQKLKEKAVNSGLNIKAIEGNMLELNKIVKDKYDISFCIGNSLVHLGGEEEILKFLIQTKSLLKEEGKLILQIINYDRILEHNVASLPTIINKEKDISFERIYSYEKSTNKIWFKTTLKVKEEILVNSIPLHPMLFDNLIKLLYIAGFNILETYGDMEGTTYDKSSSYVLVIVAS